jgi:hypothetical protein
MRELRERAGQIVKAVCLILAVVVVCQLAGVVSRWNPFRGVTVPELPVLAGATNSPAEGTPKTNLVAATAGKGTKGATNGMTPSLLTSAPTNKAGTNTSLLTSAPTNTVGTNTSLPLASSKTNSVTNSVVAATPAAKDTSSVAQAESAVAGTNGTTNEMAASLLTSAPTNATGTNTSLLTSAPTNAVGTNTSLLTSAPTNTTVLSTNQGTNLAVSAAATGTNGATGTNPAAAKSKRHPPGGPPMPGMAGKHGADLPPAVQARIQQITDSELLAPVMHPLPMALLGIAGEVAFLRSANGQTGVVKEGDTLDDLKLLRIGVNRVLIEQDGQKKELMIFSGYGGDSLMPTNSTSPNENNHP